MLISICLTIRLQNLPSGRPPRRIGNFLRQIIFCRDAGLRQQDDAGLPAYPHQTSSIHNLMPKWLIAH